MGLLFCAVITGRLEWFLRLWRGVFLVCVCVVCVCCCLGFWCFFLFVCLFCDWRGKNKFRKSTLTKQKETFWKKKQETYWVLWGFVSYFQSSVSSYMHEEGTYNGKWYFLSKIWIWHPVLIITSSDYKLCRF